MKRPWLVSLLTLLSITFGDAKARAQEKTDSTNVSVIAFPVVYRSPETRWAFGAAGALNFYLGKNDGETPSSQIQLGAAYTQEKQVLLYLPYQLFTKGRKWTFRGELGYYKYSYFYYGIGDETISDGERYELDFPRLRFTGLHRFGKHFYGGLQYIYDNIDITKVLPGGLLDQGAPGARGGAISGLGITLEYDTRDNVYASQQGYLLSFTQATYNGKIGSDFDWTKYRFDGRWFATWKRHTLGLLAYYEDNGSEVPFTQMAFIGSNRTMRGYYEGRFRNRKAWIGQTEVRSHLKGRFGTAVFLSVGEAFATRPDFQAVRWSGGAGLRVAIDKEKRINLRLDYALGEGDNAGFYFTIGEAF